MEPPTKKKKIEPEILEIPKYDEMIYVEEFIKKNYDKIVPFVDDLISEMPKKDILSTPYMWTKSTEQKIDMSSLGYCDVYKLYGYHKHCGYHGFFKPDLIEVFWLLFQQVDKEKLVNIKNIYCTTIPYPNDNVTCCYNKELDRHKGLSKVYIVYDVSCAECGKSIDESIKK